MADADSRAGARASRLAAFASLAVLTTTQDLLRSVLPTLTDASGQPAGDPEVVAEETLVLVATTSARAVEVGARANAALVEVAAPAVLEVPFLYHDYLLGAELVAQGAEGDVEVDQGVYDRLARKAEFYGVHFPVGRFPGPAALREKLPLWMGRISPPKLPTTPDARLEESGLIPLLETHLRLVLAFSQRVAQEA